MLLVVAHPLPQFGQKVLVSHLPTVSLINQFRNGLKLRGAVLEEMNAYTRLRRDGFQASDAVLRDDLSVINTPVRLSDGQLREQRRRNVLLFPGKDDADNSIFLDSNLCAISFVRRRDTKVLRGASETDEQFPIVGIDDR